MLFVYILAITVGYSIAVCPLDWAEFDNECLYFGHDRRSWNDAENDCRNRDAYLASDDNEPKHQFISKITSILGSLNQKGFWVGATDFAIEGKWRWLETGMGLNYTKWAPGQPAVNKTNNCILMTRVGNDFLWNDHNCNDRSFQYICEKGAQPASGGIGIVG